MELLISYDVFFQPAACEAMETYGVVLLWPCKFLAGLPTKTWMHCEAVNTYSTSNFFAILITFIRCIQSSNHKTIRS